jgi:hypothetical protein
MSRQSSTDSQVYFAPPISSVFLNRERAIHGPSVGEILSTAGSAATGREFAREPGSFVPGIPNWATPSLTLSGDWAAEESSAA